jgi:hypothetical protein
LDGRRLVVTSLDDRAEDLLAQPELIEGHGLLPAGRSAARAEQRRVIG